jgi:hypothetical protein
MGEPSGVEDHRGSMIEFCKVEQNKVAVVVDLKGNLSVLLNFRDFFVTEETFLGLRRVITGKLCFFAYVRSINWDVSPVLI